MSIYDENYQYINKWLKELKIVEDDLVDVTICNKYIKKDPFLYTYREEPDINEKEDLYWKRQGITINFTNSILEGIANNVLNEYKDVYQKEFDQKEFDQ